jgi:pimeloyl-ACP methyl ester carboxylesterase
MKKLVEWIVALGIAMLAMGYVLTGAARAQEAAGDWHGVLATPQGELRLGLTIKPKAGGGYEGWAANPDQGRGPIPVDAIKVENGVLSVSVARTGSSFAGTWDPAARAWVGRFTTQGESMPLTLIAGMPEPKPSAAGAPKAQEATGDWHGVLATPQGEMRLGLTIKPKPGGGYEGSLSSPDQGAGDRPLDSVTVEDGTLKFAMARAAASYSGRWDAAAKAWVGSFTQGMSIPLTFAAGKPPPLPVVAGLDGDWAASITLPTGSTQRLVLHVRTGAGGTVAVADLPDQLSYGLPIRPIARQGQKVTLEMKATKGVFEGVLSADGKTIEGTWSGQAYKGPATFTSRAIQAGGPRRPQTPKPPFPYRTEEVAVDSAPGVKLAGTLTLPQGRGPFPAVVMITGSGAQDRDETILGHKPFAVIADRLTREGIAVLRVDDRGFAKSTGVFATATDDDFAVDTAAQVAFLRKRGDIDPARIGLIGHSEGGLVAPKVAAKDPKLAFIVLMAGPGVPLGEVLRAQRAALGPAMGVSPEQLRRSQTLVDHVDAAMRGAKDSAEAEARALTVIKAEAGDIAPTPAAQQMAAKQLANDWMRTLVDYDPRPTLAKVRCPILALNGSKDGQVPPDQNLPAIRAATKANRDVTIVELPNLNHLFQTAKTGAVGEYADIEETVAPIALDTMAAWIAKHVMR